jgi:7-keto-8-aminopelargonate synthetase-like enzyme
MHLEAEEKLAAFVGKEARSCSPPACKPTWAAFLLCCAATMVVIDKDDHASIVDACRLGFGKMVRFIHSDRSSLERQQEHPVDAGILVIVDGVYSMGGDMRRCRRSSNCASSTARVST